MITFQGGLGCLQSSVFSLQSSVFSLQSSVGFATGKADEADQKDLFFR